MTQERHSFRQQFARGEWTSLGGLLSEEFVDAAGRRTTEYREQGVDLKMSPEEETTHPASELPTPSTELPDGTPARLGRLASDITSREDPGLLNRQNLVG